MTAQPARLKDVAARAGVTTSTASRALHRPELVRESTRARVEAAADALGYRPNGAARGLSTGRSQVIVLVVPDIANVHFALIGREVLASAGRRGFDVLIIDVREDADVEAEVVDTMSHWVDGIIVCASTRPHPAAARRTPVVYMNRRVRGSPAVVLDQRAVVDAQLGHLADLGHERILWVAGPRDYWASELRRRRAERWSTRLDVRTASRVSPHFAGGLQLAADLDPHVTAVAAFSDHQAIGVVHGLLAAGRRVPDDVAVVGSDDIPIAEYVVPTLTTVRVPRKAMARAAVGLLLDHGDDAPAVVETASPTLVVRESTGPPPA